MEEENSSPRPTLGNTFFPKWGPLLIGNYVDRYYEAVPENEYLKTYHEQTGLDEKKLLKNFGHLTMADPMIPFEDDFLLKYPREHPYNFFNETLFYAMEQKSRVNILRYESPENYERLFWSYFDHRSFANSKLFRMFEQTMHGEDLDDTLLTTSHSGKELAAAVEFHNTNYWEELRISEVHSMVKVYVNAKYPNDLLNQKTLGAKIVTTIQEFPLMGPMFVHYLIKTMERYWVRSEYYRHSLSQDKQTEIFVGNSNFHEDLHKFRVNFKKVKDIDLAIKDRTNYLFGEFFDVDKLPAKSRNNQMEYVNYVISTLADLFPGQFTMDKRNLPLIAFYKLLVIANNVHNSGKYYEKTQLLGRAKLGMLKYTPNWKIDFESEK